VGFLVLVLKDRYLKKPLLRLTYDGFYYGNKPDFFKWDNVRSIKVAKDRDGEGGHSYSIRIYLFNYKHYKDIADRYIEIDENFSRANDMVS
jgi:hypothetical protein